MTVHRKKEAPKRTVNSKLKILALDQATHCGWAISHELYGVWDLHVKKDESDGMRLIRFRAKLKEVIQAESIELVVWERPAGRYARGIITSAELQGQIKTICTDMHVNFRVYSAKEIKTFATGKGNAGKPAMIKAAQEKLGYKGSNDNEADALWILELAKSEYNV